MAEADTPIELDSHAARISYQRKNAWAVALASGDGKHLGDTQGELRGWRELRHLKEVNRNLLYFSDGTFHGKSFTEIVDSLPPHSRIWDLGSGDGAVALSELISQYPDKHFQGTGVTLPLPRENLSHPDNVAINRIDVDEFLRTFDRSQRPNLIWAYQMMQWIPNPLLTVKLAYNALANDGTLLIDQIYNENSPIVDMQGKLVKPSALGTYLQAQGYDVEIHDTQDHVGDYITRYSVAAQKNKNHPVLNLPIRLVTPAQLGATVEHGTDYDDEPYTLYHGDGWTVSGDTQYLYQFAPRENPTTKANVQTRRQITHT